MYEVDDYTFIHISQSPIQLHSQPDEFIRISQRNCENASLGYDEHITNSD